MQVSGATKLLDANIWLALAFSGHVHHQKAAAWFDQQAENSCAFCRITQLALLRHLTNPKIMGDFVQSQSGAWATWDLLINDPRVVFFGETAGLDAEFRPLTFLASASHERWTDAYLAAFAKASGLTMTTLDKGFGRFPMLSLELIT